MCLIPFMFENFTTLGRSSTTLHYDFCPNGENLFEVLSKNAFLGHFGPFYGIFVNPPILLQPPFLLQPPILLQHLSISNQLG